MKKLSLLTTSFILLIISIFTNNTKAQNPEWVVYNSSNSPLQGYDIECITTDINNVKWIGTRGSGLVKFESGDWTVYNTSNSGLSNNSIGCIAVDENNDKWIGADPSVEGGLTKFDGDSWTVYNSSNSDLPVNHIWCLEIDSNNHIWIGSMGGGLVKFDGVDWIIYNTSNSGLPDNSVRCITVDSNNNKWIGTYEGLAIFDGENWTVSDTSNSELPANLVNCISIDSNNDKWIGSILSPPMIIYGKGLSKFDGENWIVFNTSNSVLPQDLLSSISIDLTDTKWITTSSIRSNAPGFLVEIEEENWSVYNLMDISNSTLTGAHCVTIDKNDNKWIGTENGIVVYREGGVIVDVNEKSLELPTRFELSQNYPNPFNPTTKIKYSIPSVETGHAPSLQTELIVYDILGKKAATLVNENKLPGTYEVDFNAANLPSGVYFYKLKAGNFTESKKMMLIK